MAGIYNYSGIFGKGKKGDSSFCFDFLFAVMILVLPSILPRFAK